MGFFAVYYGLEFVCLEVCVLMTLADIFACSYGIDSASFLCVSGLGMLSPSVMRK
jgi:hypothetical protein